MRDLFLEFVKQGHQTTVVTPSPMLDCAWRIEDWSGGKVLRLKAPNSMKSLIMGFFMLSVSLGNIFTASVNAFIQNPDGKIDNLSPELRIYNQPNIVTSEADIKTTIIADKFIVINLVQNQEYFNVRYQVKPFMIWIWLSVLLISFGGLTSLIKKKHEK